MKRELLGYIATLVGGFAILLAGAYYSPSYSEQMSYIEAINIFLSLLMVFSIVVIAASLGFKSFALFMALFIAMAISLYGVYAGFLVVIMTYLVWGFVFSIQLALVHNNSKSAIDWFREHYTFKTFNLEYRVFYPMIWVFYFLWDYLPSIFYKDRDKTFIPSNIKEQMRELLS